jgi:hypothetical protein
MWRGSISLFANVVPIALLVCIMNVDSPWPVRLALIVGVMSMVLMMESGKRRGPTALAVRP